MDCTSSKRGWVRQASRAAQMPGRHLRDDGDLHSHVPGDLDFPSLKSSRWFRSSSCRAVDDPDGRVPARRAAAHLFNMPLPVLGGSRDRTRLGWWRFPHRLPGECAGGSAFILAWCLIQPSNPRGHGGGVRRCVWHSSALCSSCSDWGCRYDADHNQPGVRFLGQCISWQAHIGGRD